MATMQLKTAAETRYDAVSLGEVLLRIDPGDVPTARARTARIWQGGGETNVTVGLSYTFGLRAAVLTALVDDGVGRNIENQLREVGLDTSRVIWFNNSGKGKYSTDAKGTLHNGVNFTWAGKGVLPSVTEYYRAHTPIREIGPGDVDWDHLFGEVGTRWFSTGGIYTLLSPKTAALAEQGMRKAGEHGVGRSFDLNYRSKVEPDKERAREINRGIVPHVDFLVGNHDDFDDALGYETEPVPKDAPFEEWLDAYTGMLRQGRRGLPRHQADRHAAARGPERGPHRLGGSALRRRKRRRSPGGGARERRDRGPHRRGRFLRVRRGRRHPERQGAGRGGPVGCGPWHPGAGDPRRHHLREAGGRREGDRPGSRRRGSIRPALTAHRG